MENSQGFRDSRPHGSLSSPLRQQRLLGQAGKDVLWESHQGRGVIPSLCWNQQADVEIDGVIMLADKQTIRFDCVLSIEAMYSMIKNNNHVSRRRSVSFDKTLVKSGLAFFISPTWYISWNISLLTATSEWIVRDVLIQIERIREYVAFKHISWGIIYFSILTNTCLSEWHNFDYNANNTPIYSQYVLNLFRLSVRKAPIFSRTFIVISTSVDSYTLECLYDLFRLTKRSLSPGVGSIFSQS